MGQSHSAGLTQLASGLANSLDANYSRRNNRWPTTRPRAIHANMPNVLPHGLRKGAG